MEVGNNLKAMIPFELRVSMGMEEGMSIVDKFGSNPDVDVTTVPEYIWPLFYQSHHYFSTKYGDFHYNRVSIWT